MLEVYEAECRREQRLGRATRWAAGLGRDFAYAWRRLRATPLFTIFAIVSLAMGVGVTTAVFSVVRATLWKPLTIPHPDRVVFVAKSFAGRPGRVSVSSEDFQELVRTQRSYARVAASRPTVLGLGDDSFARTALVEGVTAGYFEVFAIRPLLGRTLDASDVSSRAQVAVVSQGFWRTRLGSDPDAIGKAVRVAGRAFTVVGVAGDSFDGIWMHPARQTSAWIPLQTLALVGSRSPETLTVVALLKPDVTAPQASSELAAVATELDRIRPIQRRNQQGEMALAPRQWIPWTAADEHEFQSLAGSSFGIIITLLISMVLVVACTNLANLMMARGAGRATERAVRQALGASRARLVREYAAESIILAALGSVGAYAVLRGLLVWSTLEVPLAAGQTMRIVPELSVEALLAAISAVVISLAVFGIGPALSLTSSSTRGVLAGSVGARRRRSQRRLIRWQVAIAAGFFIIATLFMKSVVESARHDSGIDLEDLAVAVVDFETQDRDENAARHAITGIVDEARRQPAIAAVAVSSGLPYGIRDTPWANVTRSDDTFGRRHDYPGARVLISTPGLFQTLGVQIVRGRGFDERDGPGGHRTAVLSEQLARQVFGTSDAVGRDIIFQVSDRYHVATRGVAPATVIGIASDTDVSHLESRRDGLIYLPLSQHYASSLTLVARARSSPGAAAAALRTSIAKAAPGLAVSQSGSGIAVLAGFYYFGRIVAAGVTALGFLTLILAMVGLYGVLAQGVTSRTREVGLRIALGAERREIARMIIAEGLLPIAQGLFLGLFFGYAGRYLIRATLDSDIPMLDPVVLIVVPIPIVIAGLLASYWPARRASNVDPNVALRAL